MAIAVDSTSSGSSGSSPFILSHTCSGSDRVLIVFVMSTDGGGTPSVTYNGTSMTLIVSRNIADEMKGFAFGLEDPDTGTHDISVTGITPGRTGVSAISFTGAGGWDASGAASGNNSSSANASVTVNTNRTIGYVAASAVVNGGAVTLTYLGDGTEFANFNSDDVSERIATAYTSYASGTDITEDWSKSATAKWCAVGVEVYEPSVANSGFFIMM